MKLSTKISKLPGLIFINLIMFIRPLFGSYGCCKFTLSCTQYARQELLQDGNVFIAILRICKRVLSCW